MLDIKDIKKMHEEAYTAGQTNRRKASDDMVFAVVNQWDNLESTLEFRGEFNLIKKNTRKIMGDLRSNEIQVNFTPTDEGREDGADLVDGLYRASDRQNSSIESYDNATNEQVLCGIGGWELYTEYKTNRAGDKRQVIKRRPIHEFNNNCFPDPNAVMLDKSDADYFTILVPYSFDGYKKMVHELTGEDIADVKPSTFNMPEHSFTFPWLNGSKEIIYVTRFYHREKAKDKVYTWSDPDGNQILLRKSEILDIMDELMDEGYTIVDEKEIDVHKVTLYIASGEKIIKTYEIAGENIPIIPVYGDRIFVEGVETYEGAVRLAKDPQRLRNFFLSNIGDIVSKSMRPKPVLTAAEIGKYRHMWEGGADNNFPFVLIEDTDPSGKPIPPNPIRQTPEQNIPRGLLESVGLTREAINDVCGVGLPQDISDMDLSGNAINALRNMLDEQSIVYQQNLKHAKRRDAEVWAGMAAVVFNEKQMVNLSLPDGTQKNVTLMDPVLDEETGEIVVANDLTGIEFEVFAEIGPSYSTKKEETIDILAAAEARAIAAGDQALAKALLLEGLKLVDGVSLDDIREYCNNQLIIMGFKKPETPEQEQLLQQSQQNQEPDPAQMLAMIEQMKVKNDEAKIAILAQKEQREGVKDQVAMQQGQTSNAINMYEAETGRLATMLDAKMANQRIALDKHDMVTRRLDQHTRAESHRASANKINTTINQR